MSAAPAGSGRRPAPRAWLAVALVAAAAAAAARAEAPVHPLLAAVADGRATVAGTIAAPRQLDAHGYAAALAVERTLAGPLAAGARQTIAWEELSTTRAPRFRAGERVLVVLDGLPSSSLWQQRFPAGDALVVAAGGRAALPDPDPATVEALARWAALGPDARAGAPGTAALVAIAAAAAPPLAEAALVTLAARPDLAATLAADAEARAAAAGLLADPARPAALRAAALAMAGEQAVTALRPAIAAQAQEGAPLEAAARAALAALDGGLPPETARALLARPDPALRSLALRAGGAAIDDDRVVAALRDDPAPEVRVAAAETLLARRGDAALDAVLPLLFDPDPVVRREVGVRIAQRGDAAVPALRDLLATRPYEQVSELAPVAFTLALAGPTGVAALREIGSGDPDPERRRLAELALGRIGGHAH